MNQDLIVFLKTALECSVYVSPRDPGLMRDELFEIGRRAGYLDGEIGDALHHVTIAYFGESRLLPPPDETASWVFLFPETPEYRNFRAFDFIYNELNKLTRSEGANRAQIERDVLVERAVGTGIARNDIEVAITWLLMSKQLTSKDNALRFPHQMVVQSLPSQQLATHGSRIIRKPHRERAYPIVKDVVARRADGRPKHAEPLDAFAEELEKLGYKPFRLWWAQIVAELRQTNPSSTPVAACVLAAALVEGALTFVVKHARAKGHFQSKDYEREPRSWRIDDLVASAAGGGPSAILDNATRARADALIRTRQRIHAGRMLSDYPAGPPDLRPDEARDAKATAELVVRAVLDWLQKNPAPVS
jgi:hypothetical protein